MSSPRHPRGLVDTSVVIELEQIPEDALPAEIAVSAITLAELAAGPHATDDPAERARRQDRLQRAESTFGPIPFDASTARSYGRAYAELPLYTRNPSDFVGLERLPVIVDVETTPADAVR